MLLVGGTSEIGSRIALLWVRPGDHVTVAARRPDACGRLVGELAARGATASVCFFEATDFASHRQMATGAIAAHGPLSLAVVAVGILGDQQVADTDEQEVVRVATVDYTAQISLLTVLADLLGRQPIDSTVVALSSIAGWRARRANYVYGSTKAGLDAFCQGLADRLHGSRVRVITARPGFVIGRMTEGMTPAPLSVTPAQVAQAIVGAIDKQNRSGVHTSRTLWIPRRLELLARIMRLVPRPVWRHMPR
ncbi:SDR family NAD(P)-dependent oxidoreductase [Corynebacterium mendelii]|uniref:SDR family NAD(P)-dependent oxidoreductase n=1 Tax=Corynebacterium mendelii TaxID=2765362 RepID=A0A939IT67_9CORY|nr:SDR family NAD(P)-dependent oxidoreductase [Corynebacterium mendelii]MBN9643519.1 SDR family NAD(P)-dependent oxidoreductase [Corynebacterium mendelii]